MTLKFIQSLPTICPGKSVRNLPTEALPFNWIKSNLEQGYVLLHFDGYTVNFSTKKITAFFMKKEFEYDSINEISEQKIINVFFENEFSNDWAERLEISKILNIPIFFICWPKDYPDSSHNLQKPLYIFQLLLENNKPKLTKLKEGTVETLREFIFSYRPIKFSSPKPLFIARTKMECFLSNTDIPWPGDLDGIIFNLSNKTVVALLEFKTHNLDTPIESESVSKYARQDERRFGVLTFLQDNFGLTDSKPKLLYIVWGKKQLHKKIKIQSISNNKVIDEIYLDSPLFSENFIGFTKKILELCNKN